MGELNIPKDVDVDTQTLRLTITDIEDRFGAPFSEIARGGAFNKAVGALVVPVVAPNSPEETK